MPPSCSSSVRTRPYRMPCPGRQRRREIVSMPRVRRDPVAKVVSKGYLGRERRKDNIPKRQQPQRQYRSQVQRPFFRRVHGMKSAPKCEVEVNAAKNLFFFFGTGKIRRSSSRLDRGKPPNFTRTQALKVMLRCSAKRGASRNQTSRQWPIPTSRASFVLVYLLDRLVYTYLHLANLRATMAAFSAPFHILS